MRGGVRHHVLTGQHFLGPATTVPHYALFDLGSYPGLVRCTWQRWAVHGELYEIAASLIERLNRIEGAPRLFRLEPILIDGHPGNVFAYFYQRSTEGFSLCMDGCWRNEDKHHDT
jgi:gamma-glutamylcyclotransferase (GGCT)/AIG2-like uncharacterized protein YtfP